MLLRKLPLETFVKNIRTRMLPKSTKRKCHQKQHYRNAAKKTAARNVPQKYA